MKKIFKFQLGMAEHATVQMQDNAEIIRIDGIDGFLYIWAVVNPEAPLVERYFDLFKTGADMPNDILETHRYLGCGGIFVQMELMMYVWERKHV